MANTRRSSFAQALASWKYVCIAAWNAGLDGHRLGEKANWATGSWEQRRAMERARAGQTSLLDK